MEPFQVIEGGMKKKRPGFRVGKERFRFIKRRPDGGVDVYKTTMRGVIVALVVSLVLVKG